MRWLKRIVSCVHEPFHVVQLWLPWTIAHSPLWFSFMLACTARCLASSGASVRNPGCLKRARPNLYNLHQSCRCHTRKVAATERGHIHALITWWELGMDPLNKIILSTEPDYLHKEAEQKSSSDDALLGDAESALPRQGWRDHWKQCVWVFGDTQRKSVQVRPKHAESPWKVSDTASLRACAFGFAAVL
jgi:hypothetical protein